LPEGKRANYPEEILNSVFGKGSKGREPYGLRFSTCERAELLNYESAELLFIAARSGEGSLEISLGEGRGEGEASESCPSKITTLTRRQKALQELAEKGREKAVDEVLRELAFDKDKFPVEPLEGHWI
jgi:hypothetical protein